MKKIRIILLLIPVSLLVYISCDKSFLERSPLNEASDVTFYQTESDAIAAVNAIYDVMQYSNLWKFEISVIGNRFNNDLGILPRPTQFPSEYQATNGRRLSMWPDLYAGINRANIALERIHPIDMDEALKARLLGEAKFLRGFYYFTLATFFEDVPLRLESTTLDNVAQAKSPEAEVLAQTRIDLSEAAEVLPERSGQDPADLGRATRGAAIAMLGKLELYQQNFSEALQHFETVIASGEYMLDEEYAPQFLAGGDNTPESIFEVQHAVGGGGWANSNEGSWMSGWNSSTQASVNFGFGGGIQPNEDFVNAIEVDDQRGDFIIVREGDDYFGVPFNASNSTTGFGLRKYIFPKELEQTSADSEINFHIIRYADLLLMYAEALNEVNGGPTLEAYDAINAVRNRAGLPDLAGGLSEEEFFGAIVQERRVELFLEAHRTWDLIRWGLAGEVLTPTNGFIAGRHERLPLPQTELDSNPLLEQHPAYE